MTDTIERFTAWAMCPRCKSIDCHKMREPRLSDRELVEAWEANHVTYRGYGGLVKHVPPRPVDESMFEVIRICKCGEEFGQI